MGTECFWFSSAHGAGGIFFVRNSPEGKALVSSVYGEVDNVYNRHDLKDQWSFLWHLMRPKATGMKPAELSGGNDDVGRATTSQDEHDRAYGRVSPENDVQFFVMLRSSWELVAPN